LEKKYYIIILKKKSMYKKEEICKKIVNSKYRYIYLKIEVLEILGS